MRRCGVGWDLGFRSESFGFVRKEDEGHVVAAFAQLSPRLKDDARSCSKCQGIGRKVVPLGTIELPVISAENGSYAIMPCREHQSFGETRHRVRPAIASECRLRVFIPTAVVGPPSCISLTIGRPIRIISLRGTSQCLIRMYTWQQQANAVTPRATRCPRLCSVPSATNTSAALTFVRPGWVT